MLQATVETIIKVVDLFETLGEILMQIHYASWSNFTFVFVLHGYQFRKHVQLQLFFQWISVEHAHNVFKPNLHMICWSLCMLNELLVVVL